MDILTQLGFTLETRFHVGDVLRQRGVTRLWTVADITSDLYQTYYVLDNGSGRVTAPYEIVDGNPDAWTLEKAADAPPPTYTPPPDVGGGIKAMILRRSGSTFAPILDGGQVLPNEPVRLKATEMWGFGGSAEFTLFDATGAVVFSGNADRAVGSTDAWIDTVAPSVEGDYSLAVAQSFLLRVYRDTVRFNVSTTAPAPPSAPPQAGPWSEIKSILIIALIGLGLYLAIKLVRR